MRHNEKHSDAYYILIGTLAIEADHKILDIKVS